MSSLTKLIAIYIAGGLTLWPLLLFVWSLGGRFVSSISSGNSFQWLFHLVVTYVIGGLTFIPLLLVIGWNLLPKVTADSEQESQLSQLRREQESRANGEPEGYRDLKAGEILEKETSNLKTFYQGWLTVTKEYYQFPQIDSNDFQPQTSSGNSLSNEQVSNQPGQRNSFLKMVKGNKAAQSVQEEPKQDTLSLDAKKLKAIRKKNRYFAVLKHGNLFLYDDDEKMNAQHVIVLSNRVVGIWPRSLKDGQLFTKKAAICIFKNDTSQNPEGSLKSAEAENILDVLQGNSPSEVAPKDTFFLYADRNIQKEDWYFNLLKATTKDVMKTRSPKDFLEPSFMARTLHFLTADMIDLTQAINSSEGQLTTQWLNALVGRIFLSYYRTDEFKELIKRKIDERLKKIRTPDFLDDLQIKKVDVGHSAPLLTYPKLKSLTPEGDLSVECHVLYRGGLALEVATKVFVNLGARFKQREFDINLKIVMKRLEGDLVLRLKPPPSNRVWYGFSKMPDFDMTIEPVVSSRTLNYNLITNIIKNRFKEALGKTLVLPFMDDLVFYRTEKELFKGGIWDKSARPIPFPASPKPQASPPPLPDRETEIDISDEGSLGEHVNNSLDESLRESVKDSVRESIKDENLLEPRHSGTFDSVHDSSSVLTNESLGSSASGANVAKYKEKASTLSKKFLSINKPESLTDSVSDTFETDDEAKSISSSYAKLKGFYATTKQKFAEKPQQGSLKEINYSPPEMISSRRSVKKTATTNVSETVAHRRQSSSEMFAKAERSPEQLVDSFSYEETQAAPSSPSMFINEKYRSGSFSKPQPSPHLTETFPAQALFETEKPARQSFGPEIVEHPPEVEDVPEPPLPAPAPNREVPEIPQSKLPPPLPKLTASEATTGALSALRSSTDGAGGSVTAAVSTESSAGTSAGISTGPSILVSGGFSPFAVAGREVSSGAGVGSSTTAATAAVSGTLSWTPFPAGGTSSTTSGFTGPMRLRSLSPTLSFTINVFGFPKFSSLETITFFSNILNLT
ncbi:hypothetical protein OGAPHI_000390 [Ogataea philodendri]|uniref:SMP-LTD domain-containing protein n=1 Tax=Ogataea philodendri TaxID=1378263 RepID=A0A9P8PHE9_9ASCO|nr:uncharacterized protein OGAPHI_000390 [Ogataea philodendri]KAH3671685.1 hypothetical protein OGAPHI_000390 [Ogataea philodendri]